MSYRFEKSSGDIVIDGFEKGIAPSPHLGIANMQCLDLTTEPTEASLTYERIQEDQAPISSGTFTANSSTRVSYSGFPALILGTWVTITSSSISGLSTGTYCVITVNGGVLFQLSTSLSTSDIISGLGITGTAAFNTTTTHFVRLVASTTAVVALGTVVYFMMDANGVVLYRNPNNTYWQQLTPTGPSNGNATGVQAFNGYLFRFYTDSGTGLGTVDYCSINTIVGGNAVAFTVFGNLLSTFTHQTLSGHDNTMYYTDGTYIGSIAPAFSPVSGFWTYDGSTANLVITLTSGTSLTVGMPVTLSSTVSFPSGGQLSPNVTYYVTSVTAGSSGASTALSQTLTATGTISSAATAATLSAAWAHPTQSLNVTFSDTEQRNVLFTSGSTSITWTTGLSNNVTARLFIGPTQTFTLGATVGGSSITPTGTNSGILTINSTYFNPGVAASYVWNQNALQLPPFETAQCLAELGTNLMIGGATNNVYPWDRSSTTATTSTTSSFFYPLLLPENNVVQMVTVNNMLFIFAGYKGNVYITNGSSAQVALTIPDYVTGQNEPVFTWGATMYLRGRVWFSVQAPNSGGIWSFTPTLNQISIGQDVGVQLHLENQNSNGTYSGLATVLLPNVLQSANGPQYWSGTTNGSTTYNIDNSGTGSANSPGLIETDAIPTGTMLSKRSFKQVEYKLSTALVAGESVQLYYRQDLGFNSNGAWVSLGTVITDSTDKLSGYFVANFENTQWLQIRATLTGTDSSPSFNRLKQIRIR